MASDWNDELRAKVIKMYQSKNPTAENSMDIVAEIADEVGKTVNGVRMILSKAEVYVKKAEEPKGKTEKATSTRVNKADSIEALSNIISEFGSEPDEEILGKLTGKAAVYFTQVIKDIVEKSAE